MPDIAMDADFTKVIQAADKVGEAHQRIGEHVEGIGEKWLKVNEHMAHALLRGAAMAEVMSKVNESITKFEDMEKANSVSGGQQAISRSQSAAALGDAGTSAMTAAELAGAATAEQRTDAMAGLAKLAENHGGAKRMFAKADVTLFMQLIDTGLYSSEELLPLMERSENLPTLKEAAARLASYTTDAKVEIATRANIFAKEQTAQRLEAQTKVGNLFRSADASQHVEDASSPGFAAAMGAAEGLPAVGDFVKFGHTLNKVGENQGGDIIPLLREIVKNTKDSIPRAKVNTSVHQ